MSSRHDGELKRWSLSHLPKSKFWGLCFGVAFETVKLTPAELERALAYQAPVQDWEADRLVDARYESTGEP